MKIKLLILYLIIYLSSSVLFFIVQLAKAEENISVSSVGSVTGLAIPRFVTLKARDINVRAGPGAKYPLRLNYKCKGYPVQVIAEFENWRLIHDDHGNEGWVHESLLSNISNVLVIHNAIDDEQVLHNETLLFRLPNDKARPIARVELGAIVHVKKCLDDWCNVSLGRTHDGWIKRKSIWGIE